MEAAGRCAEMDHAGLWIADCLGWPIEHGEGEQEDARGPGSRSLGGVPLVQGVSAAAIAAGADGKGGDAEGERDVGVGGAEAEIGAQAEMAVDGAQEWRAAENRRAAARRGGRRFW